jgi:hypothetical protein
VWSISSGQSVDALRGVGAPGQSDLAAIATRIPVLLIEPKGALLHARRTGAHRGAFS